MQRKRRLTIVAGMLGLAAATLTATSSAGLVAWSASSAKPVIGTATVVPATPQVGKPFAVSSKVTMQLALAAEMEWRMASMASRRP